MPFMPIPRPGSDRLTQAQEAALRAKVVAEALTWIGTPYVQQGDIKGPRGAVDCSMLLVRCWVDAGVFQPFDPRPYPPTWHMHHGDERYLAWMQALSEEVAQPAPGDVALWRFGKCFSHSGIVTRPGEVANASSLHRRCTLNNTSEAWLTWTNARRARPTPRPVKYFDLFARLRAHG
jgi:cell wall-associated NlpC family hydrolase